MRSQLLVSLLLLSACSSNGAAPPATAGPARDGSARPPDAASPADGAAPDLGVFSADAAPPADGAAPFDLANPPDLGSAPDLAPPTGPWPTADLTLYGAAQGLSQPLVDATPDAAQNIWAASGTTLYVLKPGQTQFTAFTAASGLHIQPFTNPAGGSSTTTITAIAGGRAGEVYVGYFGYESEDAFQDTDAERVLGNADRVTQNADGSLAITRYLFRCDCEGQNGCWEDRSVRRMLYAQSGVAAGHLFIGFNHGVTHVYNDTFGDHVHVETAWVTDGGSTNRQGEQYGLALTPAGDVWTGSAYGVGLQPWNPRTRADCGLPYGGWVDANFKYAFTVNTASHGLSVPAGYREDERGVALTPDGTVWFASLTSGLASWQPATGNYGTTVHWSASGLPSSLVDVVGDPDGTVWLVSAAGQLLRFTPSTKAVVTWPGVSNVRRIWLDTMVTPRALYVAMDGGLGVIRAK